MSLCPGILETYIEQYAKARNKTKSWKRKRSSLKILKKDMGKLELEAITPSRVHQYVKRRKSQGKADATVNRDLTILKHLLNYAEECGIIQANPIEKFRNLKEPQEERPRFTNEQIDAVINKVRPECRPIFIFIRETGCRREEALSLQWSQVQESSGLVVFNEDTKSRKYRYVPLTEAAKEALHVLPKLDDCPYVFYNPKTKDRWSDCRKPWENARKDAKVPELLVKDLRRQYAINLAENGAGMHDIQQVLGHASVATTEKHYAQFSPEHSAMKILKILQGGRKEPADVETKRKQEDGSEQGADSLREVSA